MFLSAVDLCPINVVKIPKLIIFAHLRNFLQGFNYVLMVLGYYPGAQSYAQG